MPKTPVRILVFVLALLSMFFSPRPGLGLTGESIIRLKAAGISDHTIEVIVSEKVVETAALSVQEIIEMKKAGLHEETIRMVVRESSFLKDAEPIVYGKNIRSIQFTTAQDIIALKKAGISDEVLQAIIAVVGDSSMAERQEALDLLEDMDIRIYLRGD